MKTSLLSIIAAFGLFASINAQAATPHAAPVVPSHVADHHNDTRRMTKAERGRYEAAQRRQEIERQRRMAAEQARLERERKLAAERARQEQLRRHDNRRSNDNRQHDYGYVRH